MKRKIIGIIIIASAILLFVYMKIIKKEDKQETVKTYLITTTKTKRNNITISYFFVDIKGEVQNPGVYKATKEDRIIDIVIKAGGFTEDASSNSVNLSQKVYDEMIIYIPKTGIVTSVNHQEIITTKDERININTATLSELMTLDGIGEYLANNIIEYRKNNPFINKEDIMKVSGIKEAIYEKIKNYIKT